MSDLTPLQQELRDMERRVWGDRQAALKRCKNDYEAEQCWNAYHQIWKAESDIIIQRHGLPGLLWSPIR